MYYEITFLGGSKLIVLASSPKEAWERAEKWKGCEPIRVKYLRGR